MIATLTNSTTGTKRFDAGRHLRLSILLILSATFVTVLSACGFQLRGYGQQSLTLESLALSFGAEVSPGSWRSALNRQLKQAGITLSPEASTKLMITDIKVEKKIVSYDSRGKAAEYELAQSVSLHISSHHAARQPNKTDAVGISSTEPNTITIPPFSDTLRRARVYTFDPENISGKNQEERLLAREIQAELIRDILLRLSDFSQRTQASNTEEETETATMAHALNSNASNNRSNQTSTNALPETLTSSTDTPKHDTQTD